MGATRSRKQLPNMEWTASPFATPDPHFEHSWEAPLSKNANLGDAVAILADHQAIESVEQDDVGLDDRPHLYHAGSPRHSSGPSEDEAVFENSGPHSSPTTSHHSDDEISELPDESRQNSQGPEQKSLPHTPNKQSSPFRNPSSVRAMQFDTTPPFRHSSYLTSPHSNSYILPTPSRNGTPRSVRSQGAVKSKLSPKKKKEYIPVLLQATIFPVPAPYSARSMEAILPPHIIENYKLLRDKISDTVLVRGILIAHPREDYELLEERLLESLELKLPRILKCGHFHLDDDDVSSDSEDEDGYNSEDDDLDICEDCGRRIRDGKHGSGSGSRRWDIKVFASNGLMRSGAWEACWREMEKIDVEIGPWIPEETKKELNAIREQELLQERKAREAALEAERIASQERERKLLEKSLQPSPSRRTITPRRQESPKKGISPRLREMDGDACAPREQPKRPDTLRRPPYIKSATTSCQGSQEEIPLPTLIKNYLYLVAQDKKNIAIGFLVLVIAFLSSSVSLTRSSLSTQVNTSYTAESLEHSTSALSSSLQEASSIPVLSSLSSYLISTAQPSPQPSSASSAQVETEPSSSRTEVSSSRTVQPSAKDTAGSGAAAGETSLPDPPYATGSESSEDIETPINEESPETDKEGENTLDLDDTSAHLLEIMED